MFYALCPYNAQELEEFSKEEIKEYLYENSRRPTHELKKVASAPREDMEGLEPLWGQQFDDPERINLIVTGGSGRFNAIIGPTLGGPTTKQIELPDNWKNLVDRYSSNLNREWEQVEHQ